MNRVSFLIIMVLLPLTASAQEFGKYAGEFMSIGVGGRALGLGSAYTALAGDVTAGYWNPAGLARIDYPQIALSHDERFGTLVNYDYGAVAVPYGANTVDPATGATIYNASSFAVSVMRLGVDGIHKADSNVWNGDAAVLPKYDLITFFNAADWVVYGTYARQHSEELYFGFNVKFIHRSIGDDHGNGIGFDAGVQYLATDRLTLGATLQDAVTTLVAWSTGTNELISPMLKLGAAYRLELLGGRLTPAVGADVRFENRRFSSAMNVGPVSFDPYGGVEFDYKDLFALRAGYNEVGTMTIGAGIHLRKLDIDYSFAKFDAADQLGNTHRISLRLTLEEDRYRRGAE